MSSTDLSLLLPLCRSDSAEVFNFSSPSQRASKPDDEEVIPFDLVVPNGDEDGLEQGRKLAAALLEATDIDSVALTIDKDGAIVASRGGEFLHVPTRARNVYDVAGAGDMRGLDPVARPALAPKSGGACSTSEYVRPGEGEPLASTGVGTRALVALRHSRRASFSSS